MIRFDVLTLFPAMFEAVLGDSIIRRAREKGLLEMHFINIRDFSKNKHRKVDDYPYSGGGGMLMAPQPIYDAYQSIVSGLDYKPLTIYLSPQGKVFRQQTAIELSKERHIVLLCGHYEGVDQRILDKIVDMELSIGDFVLTGGEIPAMAIIDAVSRMVPACCPRTAPIKTKATMPTFWNIRSTPARRSLWARVSPTSSFRATMQKLKHGSGRNPCATHT